MIRGFQAFLMDPANHGQGDHRRHIDDERRLRYEPWLRFRWSASQLPLRQAMLAHTGRPEVFDNGRGE
jgi:hypothetical protein